MNADIKGLLAQANPQLGRLLDEEARQKAQQARMQGANYGNDAMGRFLSAYSGAARSATEGGRELANSVMGNKPAMGRNEQMAVQAQQAQKAKQEQLQRQLQGKTPEQLTTIYRNALTAGNQELASTTKALLDSYNVGGSDDVTYKNVKNVMTRSGDVVPARFNNKTGRYEDLNTGAELNVSSVEVDSDKAPMLEAGVIKMINDVQTESEVSFRKAASLTNLMDRVIKEDSFTSGAFGALEKTVKGFLGIGDSETLTKKDFAAFSQVEALKLLPPGSASNVEFLTALSTVPDANSSKEVILSYLQSNLKAATMSSDFNKFKAQYMANNGGLSVNAIDEWRKQLPEAKKEYYFNISNNDSTKPAQPANKVNYTSDQLMQEINRRANRNSPLLPEFR